MLHQPAQICILEPVWVKLRVNAVELLAVTHADIMQISQEKQMTHRCMITVLLRKSTIFSDKYTTLLPPVMGTIPILGILFLLYTKNFPENGKKSKFRDNFWVRNNFLKIGCFPNLEGEGGGGLSQKSEILNSKIFL